MVPYMEPHVHLKKLKGFVSKAKASKQNWSFKQGQEFAEAMGFHWDRTRGDHHIYQSETHPKKIIDLQPVKGKAKHYQIGQMLKLTVELELVERAEQDKKDHTNLLEEGTQDEPI